MEAKYNEYLEEGTKKIIEIASSPDVGENEKRAIVETFVNELSNNVGNTEKLHDYEPLLYGVSIRFIDEKITSVLSNQNASYRDFEKAIKLCQRQRELSAIFKGKKWDLPKLENANVDKCEETLRRRQESTSISSKIMEEDRQLSSERESLSSNKKYKSFFANCEKQKNNIEICGRNGWDLPSLSFGDPNGLLNVVHKEKRKKDRAKRIKGNFTKAGIIGVCILALVIFCIYKYREGKIQIPFDSSYVVGESLSDVYRELDDAGFENITKRPDASGWLESGQVISVSIDNSDTYSKDSYKKPDVTVVITYSSEGRKYVTDLLTDWKKRNIRRCRKH